MKVNIDHGTMTKGLISKTTYHTVKVHVQFSEEEKQIIDEQRIKDNTLFQRPVNAIMAKGTSFPPDDPVWGLSVGTLVKGPDEWTFDTLPAAKAYVEDIKGALTDLKNFFDSCKGGAESQSFEL